MLKIENYFPTIQQLIEEENPPGPSRDGTIQVNTTMLIKRTQTLTDLVKIASGESIIELGCGYGFFAFALAKLKNCKVSASDVNNSYLNVGRKFLDIHPELKKQLEFFVYDYTQEDQTLENKYDVVIFNNTFCYVPDHLQQTSINNAYRMLKPNGRIYFFHPNPWYYREAFSRLPFIHWLPKTIANKILVKLNKRTIEDIFYQSPRKMRQLLETSGFINIDYFPAGLKKDQLNISKRIFGKFTPYYAMTAFKK